MGAAIGGIADGGDGAGKGAAAGAAAGDLHGEERAGDACAVDADLVDDETDFLDSVVRMLRLEGYEAVTPVADPTEVDDENGSLHPSVEIGSGPPVVDIYFNDAGVAECRFDHHIC